MAAQLHRTSRMHPKKFALYLGMASIIMAFAGLTSGYLVRKGAGFWVNFAMPTQFWVSTGIIGLTSLAMIFVVKSYKSDNVKMYKWGLIATFALTIVFLVSQYLGYQALMGKGIFLQGNPSGGFFYVITGAHAAHILGGLVFLIIAIIKAFFKLKKPVNALISNVNNEQVVKVEMLAIYWHFLGALWLYLFLFLLLNESATPG